MVDFLVVVVVAVVVVDVVVVVVVDVVVYGVVVSAIARVSLILRSRVFCWSLFHQGRVV